MCAEYERQIEAEQREVRESLALSPLTRPPNPPSPLLTRPSSKSESLRPLSSSTGDSSRPVQTESTPRQGGALETPQKDSEGVLSPSSPTSTLQVGHQLQCMQTKHEITRQTQGPRIKTNGSLPRDGKRLPSPSRAIPNSPLLSPPASAELDAGGP